MRVLVTGGSGFVGSSVVRRLIDAGDEVMVLSRSAGGSPALRELAPDLAAVVGDLTKSDSDRLPSALVEQIRTFHPELCIHLAWFVEPERYLKDERNATMLAATVRLGQALVDVGCPRMVGIGTCFEYDTRIGYLREESNTRPTTLYAASKLAAFQVLQHLVGSVLSFAWLRLFYQYGPFEDPRRFVPSVVRGMVQGERVPLTSGAQLRDYLYIDDVATAICAAATSELVGPVNIGSGMPVSVAEIAKTVASLYGRPELLAIGALPQREGDPPFICADVSRLKNATSWTPQVSLHDGLTRTIAWWERQLAQTPNEGRSR